MAASSSPPSPRIVSPEELLPDGTELLSIVIPGRPTTKKNNNRVVARRGRMRILPSANYERYAAHSRPFMEAAWKQQGKTPMDFGVGITMKVVLDNNIYPDTVGVAQAVFDLLELHGVVENDLWLDFMASSEHMISVDKDNPRLEITLVRKRHPKEAFRAEQEAKELRKQERAVKRATSAA